MAKKKNSLIDRISKNKAIKDFVMEEEKEHDFISTGSLVLNILFSGRLDGGIPVGRVNQIAAPSTLGKCARGDQRFKLAVSDSKYEEIQKFLTN